MAVRKRTYASGRTAYEVRWTEGGRRYSQTGIPTKALADALDLEKRKELAQIKAGVILPTPAAPITLDAYLDAWLANPSRPIRSSTRKQRVNILRKWVRPQLGQEQLSALTRPRLNAWRAEILTAGCGHINANRAKAALSVALSDAVDNGTLPSNPCLGWRSLPEPRSSAAALSIRQVEAIRARLTTDEDRAALSILAYVGLRPEELAGLVWDDLPPSLAFLRVQRTYVRGEYGPTKTGRTRVVPIPPPVADDLAQLDRGEPEMPVIAERTGGPWSLDRWRRKVWRPTSTAVGVPGYRVYDLRHTAATAALYAGQPLHDVHEQMGHESEMTTFRHYAKIDREARLSPDQRPLAEKIIEAREEAANDLHQAAEMLAGADLSRLDRTVQAIRKRDRETRS